MARLPVPDLGRPAAVVARQLATSVDRGLGEAEARSRRAVHGPNELPRERPPGVPAILLRQFADAMVAVLLVAIALSLWLRHYTEAATIGAITLFTVALGFVQEWRAARAMEALQRLSAPRATVVRDGAARTVAAADVVPGDILLAAQGDIVAADVRLLEAADLQAAEAILTGESVPVAKDHLAEASSSVPVGDRGAMLHAATTVVAGRARGIVVATGMDTEVGKIGRLLAGVKPARTPMQRQLARLAKWLIGAGLAAVALVVALGLQRGEPLGDMLLFGIAVSVAVVPEALPAVVTIALAIGAQRMARRNAIIRRLPAVETLGSTTVICSDKTGTLTTGQMAVVQVVGAQETVRVAGSGYEPVGAIEPAASPAWLAETARAAALCNDATLVRSEASDGRATWSVQGDPTEGALLAFAHKAGVDPATARLQWPRVAEVPFSSERKRMTTVHAVAGDSQADAGRRGAVAYGKGGPEAILAVCNSAWTASGPRGLDAPLRDALRRAAEALAADGMRVLGLARRELATPSRTEAEQGMEFLGFVGMLDAPRPEAREAIATCHRAGIRPVMITGDHPLTAAAVARQLGILRDGSSATGTELDALDDAELARRVGTIDVYARVSPAHKLRIVTALQATGEVVAMTGDGVNDAPAVRKADIGVAMGITGTDAAKEAAAMTLADDDFSTIVASVEEGRAIFDNVRKFLMFLLSTNLGEILLVAATLALGMPLPLTAVQILYVNLASDGLPALALAVDPPDRGIMERPPRRPGRALLEPSVLLLMVFGGIVSAAANLLVFLWARAAGRDIAEAMTMTFVSLVAIQLLKAYVFRSQRRSILRAPFSNRWLNLAVVWEIALLSAVVYVPVLQDVFGTHALTLGDWGAVAVAAAAVGILMEAAKWLLRQQGRQAAARSTSPGPP